jgi:hypothetical protein
MNCAQFCSSVRAGGPNQREYIRKWSAIVETEIFEDERLRRLVSSGAAPIPHANV